MVYCAVQQLWHDAGLLVVTIAVIKTYCIGRIHTHTQLCDKNRLQFSKKKEKAEKCRAELFFAWETFKTIQCYVKCNDYFDSLWPYLRCVNVYIGADVKYQTRILWKCADRSFKLFYFENNLDDLSFKLFSSWPALCHVLYTGFAFKPLLQQKRKEVQQELDFHTFFLETRKALVLARRMIHGRDSIIFSSY